MDRRIVGMIIGRHNNPQNLWFPYALGHPACADAYALEAHYRPMIQARGSWASFAPAVHDEMISMAVPGLIEVDLIEEAAPTEESCMDAITRVTDRMAKTIGDRSRKIRWRVPVEFDVTIRGVFRLDSEGAYKDFMTDQRVSVDGAVLMFKGYCRFMEATNKPILANNPVLAETELPPFLKNWATR